MKKSEDLKHIYGQEKVMTIQDLLTRMMVSEVTVRRKLKASRAITSYNKNGKYYTLPHIPRFDSYGLWNYKDIRFSKYGNLNRTIIELINASSCGMHAEAIGELIDYAPHSLLSTLYKKSLIRREKLHGRYVYFAVDEQLYRTQHSNYESLPVQYSEEDMPCATAVSLLIEKIRNPLASPSDLSRSLSRKNIKISGLQIKHFFEKHGIEKKTPGSR